MSHSGRVSKTFGSISFSGGHNITPTSTGLSIDGIDLAGGDVMGPATSTTNAVARYSDTTGNVLKDSTVTVSDAGVVTCTGIAASGTLTVTATGLSLPKASATQDTDATTGVTVNSVAGQVLTVSLATAAGSTESFTVTNSAVGASSVVLCTGLYSGVIGTDGVPLVSVNNVTTGSFVVKITNIHSTNALNGVVKVNFLVV